MEPECSLPCSKEPALFYLTILTSGNIPEFLLELYK
jgi:hypothetical protein